MAKFKVLDLPAVAEIEEQFLNIQILLYADGYKRYDDVPKALRDYWDSYNVEAEAPLLKILAKEGYGFEMLPHPKDPEKQVKRWHPIFSMVRNLKYGIERRVAGTSTTIRSSTSLKAEDAWNAIVTQVREADFELEGLGKVTLAEGIMKVESTLVDAALDAAIKDELNEYRDFIIVRVAGNSASVFPLDHPKLKL